MNLLFIFRNLDKMEVAGSLPKYDMETDISQMEAPTFTTIDRWLLTLVLVFFHTPLGSYKAPTAKRCSMPDATASLLVWIL